VTFRIRYVHQRAGAPYSRHTRVICLHFVRVAVWVFLHRAQLEPVATSNIATWRGHVHSHVPHVQHVPCVSETVGDSAISASGSSDFQERQQLQRISNTSGDIICIQSAVCRSPFAVGSRSPQNWTSVDFISDAGRVVSVCLMLH
jgi:hypothetical protein